MIVLTYHKIFNSTIFEQHIRFLSKRYKVISLDTFISKWETKTLGDKDVLITFDDGDRTVLQNALPILSKYNCPSVIFVITELIGTRRPFWWDEILYYTSDINLVRKAKLVSNEQSLENLAELRRQSDKPTLLYDQLSLEDLRAMEEKGMRIGNHSHTHPMFDKISEGGVADEFKMSTSFLKDNGFKFYNVFAYPNGNYFDGAKGVLASFGITHAFLFDHQRVRDTKDPYRISRLSINDNTPLWKFKLIVGGYHSRILPWIKAVRRLIKS